MTVIQTNIDYDVVIVGAGPSGLSFACSLRNESLKILVLEKSLPECFNTFKPDGKEIALTHLSVNILEEMGVWGYIPKTAISKIKFIHRQKCCLSDSVSVSRKSTDKNLISEIHFFFNAD